MFELIVESEFAAAHNLRNYKGACENVHGHNWRVQIVLKAERLNKQGMVMDFKNIKKITESILDEYDHRYLNQLDKFKIDNPTTENVSRLIYYKLNSRLPKEVAVKKVTTWESKEFGASYYE